MTPRYRTAFFAPSGFATSTASPVTVQKVSAAAEKSRPEKVARRRDGRPLDRETEAA